MKTYPELDSLFETNACDCDIIFQAEACAYNDARKEKKEYYILRKEYVNYVLDKMKERDK